MPFNGKTVEGTLLESICPFHKGSIAKGDSLGLEMSTGSIAFDESISHSVQDP
jgi:hypothetical protein